MWPRGLPIGEGAGNIGIGGAVASGTAGSVLFVDASGNVGQDNDKLFWDITNFRLGIGVAAPTESLDVSGNIKLTGGVSLTEMVAPTGTANIAKVFAQDNGAGKTQLMVIFGSGAAQQIAIEA